MPLSMGYTDPTSKGDLILLPAGQHAVHLASVKIVEKEQFDKPGTMVQQFQFTFESLKALEDDKPGVISLWTGLKYGHPKGALTALINAVFGRPLTQEEAARVDIEKLVGIKGYALVAPYTKGNGEPSVKFSSWLHPEKRPRPDVSAFFMDGAQASPAPAAAQASAPAAPQASASNMDTQVTPGSKSDPFAEGNDETEGDIPDPFEDN